MLIVHRMHPGASRYYLASVGPAGQGDGPRIGEAPGWWAGTGARHRDLDGPVTGRDLRAVLPSDRGRVPGFDLTFAAPKSVSVLHALGSTGVSQAVRRAHDDAVTAGLAHLEEHACVVRVDARPVRGGGFVAAAFRHRVSRAGDPHLHTHVVVANTATAPDGRWRALYSPLLYGEACGASAAYHVTLRGGLTAALGLAWEPPVRGRADAIAVPDPVRAAFSRRRAMVLAEAGDRLAERGWAEPRDASRAGGPRRPRPSVPDLGHQGRCPGLGGAGVRARPAAADGTARRRCAAVAGPFDSAAI